MTQIRFEQFNMPAVYEATQAVLSPYVSGHTTDIVMDSSDGMSHTVPIYESYALLHAILRLDLARRDLTEYLVKMLIERRYSSITTAEHEITRDVKERMCYTALEHDTKLKSTVERSDKEMTYELTGGNVITVSARRCHYPEVLLQPRFIGKDVIRKPRHVFPQHQEVRR